MWLPRRGWGKAVSLLDVDLRVAGVREVVELGLEERLVSRSASTAIAGSVAETMSRWRLIDVLICASTDADVMKPMTCVLRRPRVGGGGGGGNIGRRV